MIKLDQAVYAEAIRGVADGCFLIGQVGFVVGSIQKTLRGGNGSRSPIRIICRALTFIMLCLGIFSLTHGVSQGTEKWVTGGALLIVLSILAELGDAYMTKSGGPCARTPT